MHKSVPVEGGIMWLRALQGLSGAGEACNCEIRAVKCEAKEGNRAGSYREVENQEFSGCRKNTGKKENVMGRSVRKVWK